MNKFGEARISFATLRSKLVGKLDGIPFEPVNLLTLVRSSESKTRLRYNNKSRTLEYQNEDALNGGIKDSIYITDILHDSSLADFSGVSGLVDGGIPSVSIVEGQPRLDFNVPTAIETNETSDGFMVYVSKPNDPRGIIRLLKPQTGTGGDSVLVGHSDGTVDFSTPIASPISINVQNLNYVGANDRVGQTDANYQYKTLTTDIVVTNTDTSPVEVTLSVHATVDAPGDHKGLYARLLAVGSDFATKFVQGLTDIKVELTSGLAQWTVVLQPNQKCQIELGAWSSSLGNFNVLLGSATENGVQTVQPLLFIRRLV